MAQKKTGERPAARRKQNRQRPDGSGLSGTQGTGNILCPFFCAHGADAIRCKDIYPGSSAITTSFESEGEKRFHQKTYCEGNYQKCWLHTWAMELMWEDRED